MPGKEKRMNIIGRSITGKESGFFASPQNDPKPGHLVNYIWGVYKNLVLYFMSYTVRTCLRFVVTENRMTFSLEPQLNFVFCL